MKIKLSVYRFIFGVNTVLMLACNSNTNQNTQRSKVNINNNWLYLENNTEDIITSKKIKNML